MELASVIYIVHTYIQKCLHTLPWQPSSPLSSGPGWWLDIWSNDSPLAGHSSPAAANQQTVSTQSGAYMHMHAMHLDLEVRAHCRATYLGLDLFCSVSIFQGVISVLIRESRRANVSHHDSATVTTKRILQQPCQLAVTIGHIATLALQTNRDIEPGALYSEHFKMPQCETIASCLLFWAVHSYPSQPLRVAMVPSLDTPHLWHPSPDTVHSLQPDLSSHAHGDYTQHYMSTQVLLELITNVILLRLTGQPFAKDFMR